MNPKVNPNQRYEHKKHPEISGRRRIKTALLLTALVFIGGTTMAQNKDVRLSFYSFNSGQNKLPFWSTANQNGVFSDQNNSIEYLEFKFHKPFDSYKNKWDVSYGTQMDFIYSKNVKILPIAYWAELKHRNIIFSMGAKPDPIRFEGLSSTNANLMWSNNARPLPHIHLRSNDFIPLSKNNNSLLIKFLYEENFLLDERYTENSLLHQKNVFIKQIFSNHLSITVGLDHWVFWGGTSPDLGKLRDSYFRYITGSSGGPKAPETDQGNVSGNQLGNYSIEITKSPNKKILSFYWNHPFEDGSGKRLVNLWDGLWGLAVINKKGKKPLSGFVIEYMSSMHQSGAYHQLEIDPNDPERPVCYGSDNYFNHSVYRSGFTHYGQMMGSPFFLPYKNENGISMGFKSTRMKVLHLGMKGSINKQLLWQTMTSFSKNYGTYSSPFPKPLKVFNYLLKLNYQVEKWPLQLDLFLTGDSGKDIENIFGCGLGIQYQIK